MEQGFVPNTLYERAVLIDSSALYALTDKRDQYHESAKLLLIKVQEDKLPIFITNTVVIESFRLILHRLGRSNAHIFLENLISDIESGSMKIVRMSDDDENEAQKIVFNNKGHDLTLTDSINFSVMLRLGIYKMFGFDSDCNVVGFELYSI